MLSKERIQQYIESVKEAYHPAEQSWWQHPAPVYHYTKDYAVNYNKSIDTTEAVVIKKEKREWLLVVIMLVVAAALIYILARKEFNFTQLFILVILMLVVLPRLLDSKVKIRISREGIWLYKDDRDIIWEHVILTYIKEICEEKSSYSFILHYYDEDAGEFASTDVELDGMVSPAMLAAAIEAFRNS